MAITRDLLERYRADVFLLDRSPGRKSGLLTDLKVFLDDVRLHDWAAGLPANATYYRGEIPRDRKWLPRFIDEFVMGQLETRPRTRPAPGSHDADRGDDPDRDRAAVGRLPALAV